MPYWHQCTPSYSNEPGTLFDSSFHLVGDCGWNGNFKICNRMDLFFSRCAVRAAMDRYALHRSNEH